MKNNNNKNNKEKTHKNKGLEIRNIYFDFYYKSTVASSMNL